MKMRSVKQLMRDVPYSLPAKELKWMGTYMMGETYSDFKRLNELADSEGQAREMTRSLRRERLSKSRDITRHPDALKEYTRQQQVTDYQTQEERMAGAIDLLRDWEKAKQFKPYGDATALSVGDQVVIAVEGHSLQGRKGVVAGQRAGQYLIEVETRNGTVKAYLNARDCTVVSRNKFGGVK